MSVQTSANDKFKNSSPLTTSGKFSSVKLVEATSKSEQECISARKKCFRVKSHYRLKKGHFCSNYQKIEFQDSLKDEVGIEEIDSMNLAPRTKKVN